MKYIIKLLFTAALITVLLMASVVTASAIYLFDNMDNAELWSGGNAENKLLREGKGAVSVTGDNLLLICKSFDPIDLSRYEDGYIRLWIYIDNPNNGYSGQLELTSSGECDNGEAAWLIDTSSLPLNKGWNEVLLSLNQLNLYNPDPDREFNICAVNFCRLYIWNGQPATMVVDNITFGLEKEYGELYKAAQAERDKIADQQLREKSEEALREKESREAASATAEPDDTKDTSNVKPVDKPGKEINYAPWIAVLFAMNVGAVILVVFAKKK